MNLVWVTSSTASFLRLHMAVSPKGNGTWLSYLVTAASHPFSENLMEPKYLTSKSMKKKNQPFPHYYYVLSNLLLDIIVSKSNIKRNDLNMCIR